MSNIYIHEPPTNGKVLLLTTVGDIDVELWSKEAPKACRNFVQLCLESYYDNLIFHRVVKEFIVQGGDPTGTGHGGESIYGQPFKDEFHSRLRFTRRGLLGMANAGPNDNGSQFFFTLAAAPELNNKHTIFAKVTGDTLYNMIKLGEADVDEGERPVYPMRINKTKVLANPFEDIIPRVSAKNDEGEDGQKKKKSKSKATKNFKLLSFGDEAEEDEEETEKVSKVISKKMRGKGKSSHDLLDDKALSSVPAVGTEGKRPHPEGSDTDSSSVEEEESGAEEDSAEVKQRIRKKLKKDPEVDVLKRDLDKADVKISPEELVKLTKTDELKREVKLLQKELNDRKKKVAQKQKEKEKPQEDEDEPEPEPVPENDLVTKLRAEREKYKEKKQTHKKGVSDRESKTLALLAKFQSKLNTARQFSGYGEDEDEDEEKEKEKEKEKEGEEEEEESEEEDQTDMSWMSHKLRFADNKKKVLDPNIDDVERYEISDPRNPLTKRRREQSKQAMKSKR